MPLQQNMTFLDGYDFNSPRSFQALFNDFGLKPDENTQRFVVYMNKTENDNLRNVRFQFKHKAFFLFFYYREHCRVAF